MLSQESKEQFSDLCLRFHFDLMPIGAVEELEVERMAMLHWKLQRLWRFENGLIGLATHTVFKRQVRDEMQPTVAELSSQQSNRAKVMDADVSTSSAPEGTLVGADTRSIQKLLRDAEFCNVAEAQLDAEAVPHALYLDIIHRAQSATEKGLNDALKRFKSLRKFRLTTRLADDQLSFAQATYHEDGSVTI